MCAVLPSGCSLFHKNTPPAPAASARSAPAVRPTSQPSLIVAPTTSGKVASINAQARFAVLVFPIGAVPPPDTRMVVYHGDAKIGEIRITGPTQENVTVGDIVVGTAQVDDDVRSN